MSFTLEKKEAKASPIRAKGSTILENDFGLKIVYNKYKTTCPLPKPESQLRFNLIFCHGTGFNKSIWNYHIRRLYQLSQSFQVPWFLDSVISIDAVGHGDSSLANYGKLGPVFCWDDGSRDVIEVIRHESDTTGDFQNNNESRNVLIGHSMGGYIACYAAFLAPSLFDSIIPFEAVIYSRPDGITIFKKLFSKIATLMLDTFDSEDEAKSYFSDFSFTKKFDRRVLDDYMADEIFAAKDPESGEDVYKIKCMKPHQISAYLGAFMSLPKGMSAIPHIRVPTLHVIGEKAKWNPPESVGWVRSAINKNYLAGTVDMKDGEHLVVGEQPDDTVEVIKYFINKRDAEFKKEKLEKPEVQLKGDKKAIFDKEFGAMMDFDLDNMYGYELATTEDVVKASKL
ncbi:uncharacterized protein LODBEIA_P09770 [Lodderomyces beijingensis]|uniref:AB hydrolase-1 domain-containing protein n=1 Tax=Lodderomyces beijingensis TaxID=1775926 RepID=A0ABP0ZGM8_9ASCO